MRTYHLHIQGDDVFDHTIYISAQSFQEAYAKALKYLDAYHNQTIEQLRIVEIGEDNE